MPIEIIVSIVRILIVLKKENNETIVRIGIPKNNSTNTNNETAVVRLVAMIACFVLP